MNPYRLIEARYVLGALDMIGAVLMVWAFQRITTIAGLKTTTARWALFRRMLYCSMAFALFGLGVERIFNDYRADLIECLFQGTLLVGIIIFPLLRAFGWISQDSFVKAEGLGRAVRNGH